MKVCQKCGEEWTRKESPGFKATCAKCETYLHSCRNCRLYNPSADRCSSVTAECTGDRGGLNYCEEFQFRDAPANGGRRNGAAAAAATLGLGARVVRLEAEPSDKRPSSPFSRESQGPAARGAAKPATRGRDKFDKLFNG